MSLNLWEIAQLIFYIYVVLKLMTINHNQRIIVDNQKILNENLNKLSGKDKSILDNIFKEK